MHIISLMNMGLIVILIWALSSIAGANNSCFEWFLLQKIKPEISKEACEMACSTAETDMGTFNCGERCEYFCANRKCVAIWSKGNNKKCKEMTEVVRAKLLENSRPENFPKLGYQSPPESDKTTDCSHFVHSIFEKTGLTFEYQATGLFHCTRQFDEISRNELKAGDLVVYGGHVGIYTGNDEVLSATVGGPNKRSMLDPSNPQFLPTIKKLKMNSFGKPIKFLRWSCNQ